MPYSQLYFADDNENSSGVNNANKSPGADIRGAILHCFCSEIYDILKKLIDATTNTV